ncbi:MAG: carboxypeptidase regulatory-like domain-containing protein, partial [Planctomycetes bacterium]|nr:carboxypeptidase regulatory-like domain-containing protein [Planctomycetota bacterium]
MADNTPKTPIEAKVSGTIVGESGDALMNVKVRAIAPSGVGAYWSGNGANPPVQDTGGEAITAADGTFSMQVNGKLSETSEDGRIAFQIEAPGYGIVDTEAFSIRRSGTREGLEVRLFKPVTIRGKVLNRVSNEPMANAMVRVSRRTSWMSRGDNKLDLVYPSMPKKVGSDGSFEFLGVPGGKVSVSASLPSKGSAASVRFVSVEGEYSTSGEEAKSELTIQNGVQPADVLLYLDGEAKLLFRIAQAEVQGVSAKLVESSSMSFNLDLHGNRVISPKDGVYSVEGLKPSHVEVEIRAEGYAPTRVKIAPKSGEDLDIGVIELKLGQTIRGVVQDTDGNSLANVTVEIGGQRTGIMVFTGDGTSRPPQTKSTKTAKDGTFTLEGIEVGSHQVSFSLDGFADQTKQVLVEDGKDPAPLLVVMTIGGSVSGSATLPSTKIDFDNQMNSVVLFDLAHGVPSHLASASYSANLRSSFNVDGTFTIRDVPTGTYLLYAQYYGRSARVENVAVRIGEETKVNVVFPPDGTVQGTITLQDGA